jgi:hypothetical protein
MARKKKPETAKYECILDCTYPVFHEESNEMIDMNFSRGNGDDKEPDTLVVPAGELVCKHFDPVDEQAEKDRDDQMEHPEKYAKTLRDLVLLSEIMVKEGFFANKEDAKAAIEDLLEEDLHGENKERDDAIKNLLSQGDDKKAQRKVLNAILREGGVTGVFPGSDPKKLAELVYDNDLYKG